MQEIKITKNPYIDLKQIISYLDKKIFENNGFNELSKIQSLTKRSNSIALYDSYSNSFKINTRLKKYTTRSFYSIITATSSNNKVVFPYSHSRKNISYANLPSSNYIYSVISIACHELRHKYQHASLPNLFLFINNYFEKECFCSITNIVSIILDKKMNRNIYTRIKYLMEFDAKMIEFISLVVQYQCTENGKSLSETLDICSELIVSDSDKMLEYITNFSYIGKPRKSYTRK